MGVAHHRPLAAQTDFVPQCDAATREACPGHLSGRAKTMNCTTQRTTFFDQQTEYSGHHSVPVIRSKVSLTIDSAWAAVCSGRSNGYSDEYDNGADWWYVGLGRVCFRSEAKDCKEHLIVGRGEVRQPIDERGNSHRADPDWRTNC
jgi:hypothetical protein